MQNILRLDRFAAVFVFVAAFLLLFSAGAQAEPDVQFPVKELGGCGSKEACHAYCEIPKNMESCLDFAEKNGLMSESEIAEAKKFAAMGGKGPGGCTTKDSCESFCDDIAHIKECLSFAEKSGMMSGPELEEAKKVAKFLESGGKLPGGCRNEEECDSYCKGSNADHMKECITFAKEAGFLSEEELEDVDMLLTALEKGVAPPNCRGDEECAVYCSQPENIEGCVAFALASGRMTEEDAERMRKSGGKGPGGCIGKECETFCDNPENSETCFNFAKERGDIPADQDYQKMQEGRDRFRLDFESMPADTQNCLRNSLGGDLDEMLKGNPPPEDAREKMEECWKKMEVPRSDYEDRREGGEFNREFQEGMQNFENREREGEQREPQEQFERSEQDFREFQNEAGEAQIEPEKQSLPEDAPIEQPENREDTGEDANEPSDENIVPPQSRINVMDLLGLVLSSFGEALR